jgi:hypothetical protein
LNAGARHPIVASKSKDNGWAVERKGNTVQSQRFAASRNRTDTWGRRVEVLYSVSIGGAAFRFAYHRGNEPARTPR